MSPMPRADRLTQLIQILRDGALHKAADLAAATNVSQRTIYRDMERLASAGVPIAGARGIGYWVTAQITLPPLNLTTDELEALHLGLSVIADAGDEALKTAAKTLSAKVDAVLPEDRETAPTGWGVAAYPFADAALGFQHMPQIRAALRARQKIAVQIDGQRHILRPLKLDYWGRVWTCIAWSETNDTFTDLRLDQITDLRVLPELFTDEPGKRLMDR